MQNIPSDLIQQALDILHSDNTLARIYTQGTRNGGVLVLEGNISGITGDNLLLVDDLHIQGTPSTGLSATKISFDSIIEIQSITQESE